jgi:hypothetical protein
MLFLFLNSDRPTTAAMVVFGSINYSYRLAKPIRQEVGCMRSPANLLLNSKWGGGLVQPM